MIPLRHFLPLLLSLFVLPVSTFNQTADAQPADSLSLACTFRGSEGILAPQQSLILDVLLRSPPPNSNAPLTLRAELANLSLPDRPRIASFTTQITPGIPLPMSFVTPDKDGIYEIILTAVQESPPNRPILNLNLPRPPERHTVETRRQFVVLGSQVPPRFTGDWTLTDKRNLSLIDHASADSPPRRLLSQLPSFPKFAELTRITDFPRPGNLLRFPQPFGRHSATPSDETLPEYDFNHLYGNTYRFWDLPAPVQECFLETSEQNPEFSALVPAGIGGCTWHSLSMETEIGKPYLVEIDYPVNIPQTLGVGIVDPAPHWRRNVLNTAATIHVAEEIVQEPPSEMVTTHRLLFWAATEHPELVLINRQPHREALFRNIRVSRITTPGSQEDQRFPKLFEETAQRKRIGQILGANGFLHLTAANTMNWQAGYERCSRLLDTLCRGGYDGVTLTVLSKESVLCPMVTLHGREANEVINALEMMFRRFDSEGLTLIPAIEFDMPIPALEQLMQQEPAVIEQILIGNPEDCRYNLLHPAVQQAMSEIILELVDRFQHHPSFGGVAVVLSPAGYAQLPFALYLPDDHTFTQFRQDTEKELGIPFPDEQPFFGQKNSERLPFLVNNPKVWETWVRWRAAKISRFYADLAKQMAAKRDNAPLYLLGGTMFDQIAIQQFCMPALPRNAAPLQAIQLLGFDLPLISQTEPLRFLRPVAVSEGKNHSYNGLDSADTVPHFSKSGMLSGVQFVHADTDYFVTTPAHIQSRKRFVRQLVQTDVFMFMDAGVSLPFGPEPAMFDLLDTYRRLPPVLFQTFQPTAENASLLQPLTIRYNHLPDGMMIYIVNDAPFAVEADFCFAANPKSSITELTGHRMIRTLSSIRASSNGSPQRTGSHTWRVSLLPYDLLAIQINDAKAKIESVSVHLPPSLYGSNGTLKQKVEELKQRFHTARGGVLWEGLINADFELPANGTGEITGWQCFGESLTAMLDQTAKHKGQNSVRLTNGSAESGMFLSQPVAVPKTGRLDVSMVVGVPANSPSLPMSVVLSAKYQHQPFYRSLPVGETLMPLLANVEPRNGVRWHRLIAPFRLPLESLEEVRIGVQYSDNGTVWLDDITLHHVSFSADEMVELQKMLIAAEQRCDSGRFSDLMSLLEGYWAQFLFQYVPASIQQPTLAVPILPIATESAPPKSPTMYQRVKGWFGAGE